MNECFFCQIANKEIPSRIVYEDDIALGFQDAHPQAPTHILVIPKHHCASLIDIESLPIGTLAHLLKIINKIAKETGLHEKGFRVVSNSGIHGGQTVFHLHFHILGGRPMRWPPG